MTSALTILSDPPPAGTPIGLIAGGGRLPVLVAEGLRAGGHPVHGLGLGEEFDPMLPPMCASFQQVGIFRVGGWGGKLRRLGVQHAIMVGRVDKARLMFDPLKLVKNIPDIPTLMGYYRTLRHDRRSHVLLGFVARQLELAGVQLLDSTAPIDNHLASPGVMTSRQPTAEERIDYQFAWPLLGELLRLDIGQAVAVKDRDIIAVEGIEGTDRMIERTGVLCRRGGWTLCKGARSGHDRRSDVPTVGVQTVENLAAAGGTCLAIASGNVIMIDKIKMLETADQLGVAVVGVPMAGPGALGEGHGAAGGVGGVGGGGHTLVNGT
ncbi:MAG: UDP-2,3-diacylglucosamine diphosphatase LpxI [Phycisphaerales bacterium]